jgi:hypothetical protein
LVAFSENQEFKLSTESSQPELNPGRNFEELGLGISDYCRLRQPRKNPACDANLVMISYSIFEFDPNSSAFVCVANALVINLERIDWLDQVCLFTLDVDHVTQIDLTIGQFDDPDVYSRIIVNNTPDERFSYANSHNKSPIF